MIREVPDAIMINIPLGFFTHGYDAATEKLKNEANRTTELQHRATRETMFRRFYEQMGNYTSHSENDCFYHFIGTVPVHPVTTVFVCFNGFVQYKAIIVEFLRNQPVMLPTYQHPEPRNWMITTGPVVKAPHDIPQKGFRGFRYTKMLF